jgi:hypothetical protein
MRSLKGALRRRTVALAAAAVVTGGMASAMALPGTAYADSQAVTQTSVLWSNQWQDSTPGTYSLQIGIQVVAQSGNAAPDGLVTIGIANGPSCTASLGQDSHNPLASDSSCTFGGLTPGSYQAYGKYSGDSTFTGSWGSKWEAVGTPRSDTKVVTSLDCTSHVHGGQVSACTLWATNTGPDAATSVRASISLPWALHASWCRPGWYCSTGSHSASVWMGTLWPGQTRTLQVFFRLTGWSWSWGAGPHWVTAYGRADWTVDGVSDHSWSSDTFALYLRGRGFR